MTSTGYAIHVAGTGLRGSGYPNAAGTLRMLRGEPGITVHDRARWLPEGTTLWRKAGSLAASLPFLARLAWANGLEALRVMRLPADATTWVYVPYPAVFLLWWLSWVPRRWRPRVVADAYVSLWDAAFRDRRVSPAASLVSRGVRRFEARALRSATMVTVDTVANRDAFVADFGLDASRVRAIPLALEAPCTAPGPGPHGRGAGPLQVLFVGTLVPLHGIRVIVEAVRKLVHARADMHFTFIGDGQDRDALEQLVSGVGHGHIEWHRDWLPAAELSRWIAASDVCLGVFGGQGKAARVFPFKVYLALAAGKPVVTQEHFSLPQGAPPPPLVAVAPDADSLAQALATIAGDRSRLDELSDAAGRYYAEHLSAQCIARHWRELLSGGAGG